MTPDGDHACGSCPTCKRPFHSQAEREEAIQVLKEAEEVCGLSWGIGHHDGAVSARCKGSLGSSVYIHLQDGPPHHIRAISRQLKHAFLIITCHSTPPSGLMSHSIVCFLNPKAFRRACCTCNPPACILLLSHLCHPPPGRSSPSGPRTPSISWRSQTGHSML